MSQPPSTPSSSPARPPEKGLRALAVRLARLRAAVPDAPAIETSLPPPAAPQPGSAWERAAEQRLGVIEKTLNNQNRLLLLTLVSVVADVALGAAK